jgi:energy-coupling factor transporter ATP-binding protein EcfA2
MTFNFSIPSLTGQTDIGIEAGSSAVFVGANGGGKTRLAVHIENAGQLTVHRISAHRALTLNPAVPKISERTALLGLRTGNADENAQIAHRKGSRWQHNMAVSLLNDFDFLIQALFADQANKSLETHKKVRAGNRESAEPTKFERLIEIWKRLLPHRELHIAGDDVQVTVPGLDTKYKASDMSDGERAIFYLIGQTLAAADNSLIIFDEPELHVHRSIITKLWDELEAARQDCAFVFITHDLEFAASRVAQKFVIREYRHEPSPCWTFDAVPKNTGFSEELTTLILGSRRPVLFVEGANTSLDISIYRCCFPDWTVIPRGSCEEVIHSVVTMRRNQEFTRVTCSGIVDADDHHVDDIAYLNELGIFTLAVSEIENVILMPDVSRAIAESEGYTGDDLEARLRNLKSEIFNTVNSAAAIDAVVTRYCLRRIDRFLKKIDLSGNSNISGIVVQYGNETNSINIVDIANSARTRISDALQNDDLPKLLANYDNKAMMALASRYLKTSKLADFESWLVRVLRNNKVPALTTAIRTVLPTIQPQ